MLPITQVVELMNLLLGFVEGAPEVKSFMANMVAQMPQLEQAGIDVVSYANEQLAKVSAMMAEGRDPTDAEWAGADADEQAEDDKMHRPPTTA